MSKGITHLNHSSTTKFNYMILCLFPKCWWWVFEFQLAINDTKSKRRRLNVQKLTNYIIYESFISVTFYFLPNWGIEASSTLNLSGATVSFCFCTLNVIFRHVLVVYAMISTWVKFTQQNWRRLVATNRKENVFTIWHLPKFNSYRVSQ